MNLDQLPVKTRIHFYYEEIYGRLSLHLISSVYSKRAPIMDWTICLASVRLGALRQL